jgi:hypothetical protein
LSPGIDRPKASHAQSLTVAPHSSVEVAANQFLKYKPANLSENDGETPGPHRIEVNAAIPHPYMANGIGRHWADREPADHRPVVAVVPHRFDQASSVRLACPRGQWASVGAQFTGVSLGEHLG